MFYVGFVFSSMLQFPFFNFHIKSDKIEINKFGGTVTNYIYSKFETWFDQTPTKVNINKRFIAYIIDSFIGGLFTNFPIAMTWLVMTKNVEAVNRVNILMIYKHISINATILALILSTLAALLYYFVIPTYVKNGQTFGKSIMKFKVVKLDGSNVGAKEMFLRQVVGIIILEGTFYGISTVLRWGISIITGLNFTGILMYLGLGISLISLGMLIFSGSKRMLHDYIGKTKLELVEE